MPNAVVNEATSGDRTIIAAPGAGKQIEVRGYHIVSANTVTATWKSGSTALTGAMSMAVGNPFTPYSWSDPVFLLGANEALVLTLGGSVQVSGHVTYVIRNTSPTAGVA
jgi:hypothetical protein